MEEISITIDDAQKAIDAKDAVLEMYESAWFKTVFTDGYFGSEARRLPLALVDDEMQDDVEQRILNEKVKAIGHLHVYLNTVVAMGRNMEAGLEAQEREQARANIVTETDEITGESFEVTGEV